MRGQFWLVMSCYIITIICKLAFCIKLIENEKSIFGFKSKKKDMKKLSNIKVRNWKQKKIQQFFIINKVKNKKYNNLKKSLNMEYSNTDDQRLSLLKNLENKSKIITQSPAWNEKIPLLEINDLHAIEVEGGKEILKGINLTIYLGEKHSIMGRNGSGKSTLAKVIAGHPYFKVTKGSMKFKGLNLTDLTVNHRSLCGIFLAFQYPIELPMVKNNEFLRTALNCHRRQNNEPELSPSEFDLLMINEIKKVGLSPEFLDRPVNYGFSGGEKKRNEILQMLILKPSFCILDETDSGLDVDSFKLTSDIIQKFSNINNSFLIVTHYKKLLELLKPNYIHIMHKGKIIKTGNYSLVDKIESDGYAQFVEE
ncbi:FeS assembly ATPase SufC [Plasmodium berghei]|uniref:Iron-sulfur cluster assembly protein SufC n=2 Tax=Plasmodium berghei TaxID=5821 RepID=SUFC_PLABA|nr:ABC transporter I family member 1 [Plasmodium berghei ANKA]A0A509AN56.1 RecName: Full=Iron-sulfur cluster assembly protein SufC [Plasmodium berghei ANKA]CXI54962.1 FeS assembly ATPase SufC [Plasmodium berghei]SCL95072.1 FeS assembly ATPase SufC [Plasmodium berghei]SCM16167.1 FeS assembly ATPase SufC [Plasmodium berghei]SCM17963.1 FeS assembly ATPase SufC [Plasmodium berghei]SCN26343.1 FeS assembly ATPase SufC [Plasmodium berghei]|eukprot:XP_034422091.1 ABC transporter I family member 1 [Plasmodium berghei ANKA]